VPDPLRAWGRTAAELMLGSLPQGGGLTGATTVRTGSVNGGYQIEVTELVENLSGGRLAGLRNAVGLNGKLGWSRSRGSVRSASAGSYSLGGGVADNRGASTLYEVTTQWRVSIRTGNRNGSVGPWTEFARLGGPEGPAATGGYTDARRQADLTRLWVSHAYDERGPPPTETAPAGRQPGMSFPAYAPTQVGGLEQLVDRTAAKLPGPRRRDRRIHPRPAAGVPDRRAGRPARRRVRGRPADGRHRPARPAGRQPRGLRAAGAGRDPARRHRQPQGADGGPARLVLHDHPGRLDELGQGIDPGGGRRAGQGGDRRRPAGHPVGGSRPDPVGLALGRADQQPDGDPPGCAPHHGHTQGYAMRWEYTVTIQHLRQFDGAVHREEEVTGGGDALLRMAETDAYRYGLPVDAAAVTRDGATTTVRGEPVLEAPPGRAAVPPTNLGNGADQMRSVGHGMAQDIPWAKVRAAREAAEKLLRELLVIPPVEIRDWTRDPVVLASQLANLRDVRELFTPERWETGYDRAVNGGLAITLENPQSPGGAGAAPSGCRWWSSSSRCGTSATRRPSTSAHRRASSRSACSSSPTPR
jgi:hypothetical protein